MYKQKRLNVLRKTYLKKVKIQVDNTDAEDSDTSASFRNDHVSTMTIEKYPSENLHKLSIYGTSQHINDNGSSLKES